ncbi:hypothetical protein JXQ31_03695 [candidate division KSB1 bacterium]|nr:hypothetical protein [candidate division KSB1 bacterium]
MRSQMLFIVFLTGLLLLDVFAGDQLDFSGEWVLNENKSMLDENGTNFLPSKLMVTQKGNDITIVKTFQREYEDDFVIEEKLTLDGKECKSEFWNSPRTTTATWSAKGDTLTIASKIFFEGGGQSSEMILNEAWSIKDRNLSIKHFSSSSWGERKITIIFDKQKTQAGPKKESK